MGTHATAGVPGVVPVLAGGKLQPVINVATAKLLGAEFAASVLKVARTVH